jgi:Skp family chaperone for outer membrane proteins
MPPASRLRSEVLARAAPAAAAKSAKRMLCRALWAQKLYLNLEWFVNKQQGNLSAKQASLDAKKAYLKSSICPSREGCAMRT